MEHAWNLSIPPQPVLAELTSEPLLLEFADEVGVQVTSLDLSQQGEHAVAAMEWTFRTDHPGFPSAAKRFLPDVVELGWRQWWGPVVGGSASGGIEVDLKSRPSARLKGTTKLAQAAGGSTLTTRTRTKADLPFPIAGRVEGMVDKQLASWILSTEVRVLHRRLGQPE